VNLGDDDLKLEAQYRAALGSRTLLLILDNALDARQVEPLLPTAPSRAIVTSRQRFTLHNLEPIEVPPLPREESKKLLLRLCGRIDNASADEIARLCGDLPLALELAGNALARRDDLTPGDYIRRLADESTRLANLDEQAMYGATREIQAAIAVSEALIEPELRPLMAALSVFPATFDARAAAAICFDARKPPKEDAVADPLLQPGRVRHERAALLPARPRAPLRRGATRL
jgi:hypothetical protein